MHLRGFKPNKGKSLLCSLSKHLGMGRPHVSDHPVLQHFGSTIMESLSSMAMSISPKR